jgi:hypothetical protein
MNGWGSRDLASIAGVSQSRISPPHYLELQYFRHFVKE